FHGLLDVPAHLDIRIDLVSIVQAQLTLRDLQLLGVVGKDFPAAERLVVPALAVDGNPHIPLLAMFLAAGRGERGFESLEDDFFVDALLVRDGIDHHQYFLVHASTPLLSLRMGFARYSWAAPNCSRGAQSRTPSVDR